MATITTQVLLSLFAQCAADLNQATEPPYTFHRPWVRNLSFSGEDNCVISIKLSPNTSACAQHTVRPNKGKLLLEAEKCLLQGCARRMGILCSKDLNSSEVSGKGFQRYHGKGCRVCGFLVIYWW